MKDQGSSAALPGCNKEVRKKVKEFVGENSQKLGVFIGVSLVGLQLAGIWWGFFFFPWIFVHMKLTNKMMEI